jgi:hypothetical protein
MHHVNEAHRLIHLFNVGPRALARVADVSPSTAAAWHAGRKKPGDLEKRAAIELELRIPREAWDLAPGRFTTEGQLQLWLALDPRCRGCDGHCGEAGRTPCPVDAVEHAPEPAA